MSLHSLHIHLPTERWDEQRMLPSPSSSFQNTFSAWKSKNTNKYLWMPSAYRSKDYHKIASKIVRHARSVQSNRRHHNNATPKIIIIKSLCEHILIDFVARVHETHFTFLASFWVLGWFLQWRWQPSPAFDKSNRVFLLRSSPPRGLWCRWRLKWIDFVKQLHWIKSMAF